MKSTMDLTSGKPMRKIVLFSLPLVAGTIFQQLYSFVDTIMVGRLIGQDALASVGATQSLNFLILGFVQGCCIGFSLPLAKEMGARDHEEFRRYFWNGCCIASLSALILCVLSVGACGHLLYWIQTPDHIFASADTYLKIIFAGIPFAILYNFGAAILRASGDCTRPTLFLVVSGFSNIVLDYVLIAVFDQGVSGAAYATIVSQLLSGILNFWWIFTKTELLKGSKGHMSLSKAHLFVLMKKGLPMGFEYSISALGALIMQSAINQMGIFVIAGQTAGEKIRQMLTLPMESVGMAMATYAGQNDGAKRNDRLVEGIKAGLLIQMIYCVAMWFLVLVYHHSMSELVLGNSVRETVAISDRYLRIMSCLFPLHGSLMIVRNTLQGMGHTMQAVFSGIGELIGRALGSVAAIRWLGFTGICFANPFAWLCALIYCTVMCSYYLKSRFRAQLCRN